MSEPTGTGEPPKTRTDSPPGCLLLGLASVVALVVSVLGICGGSGDSSRLAMQFFVVVLGIGLLLAVAAIVAGLIRLIFGR